jgi:hypothetical protein
MKWASEFPPWGSGASGRGVGFLWVLILAEDFRLVMHGNIPANNILLKENMAQQWKKK